MDDIGENQRDTIQGNIVSTFQAGCFFGALFTFPIAERFGRRLAIMLSACIFVVGATLQTASPGKLGMIYAGRL